MIINKKNFKSRNKGVYKIACSLYGEFYIGSSVDLYTRLKMHDSALRRNKHHSIYMQRVYNKYGKDTFYYEIIEYVDDISLEELRKKEEYYIKLYQPKFTSQLPVSYEITQDVKDRIRATLKRKYLSGEIIYSAKATDGRLSLYDYFGNLLIENASGSKIAAFIKLSNRSVVNNALRNKKLILCQNFIFLKTKDSDQYLEKLISYIKDAKGLRIRIFRYDLNFKKWNQVNIGNKNRVLNKVLDTPNLILHTKKSIYTFVGLLNYAVQSSNILNNEESKSVNSSIIMDNTEVNN